MSEIREIHSVKKSQETLEGAGVRLHRVFGQDHPKLDPFLLLDDFSSNDPKDYLPGFPWHPHRGIETITYILEGKVAHEDSLGNKGVIESGDVQWMTAGSGIIHQEMPVKTNGLLVGFQLWANLPSSHKMMEPRYRDVKSNTIPVISVDDRIEVKIISGEVHGTRGPVQDIVTDPLYLDITMPPNTVFDLPIKEGHNTFAYIFQGEGFFDASHNYKLKLGNLVIYEDGDSVQITTSNSYLRFLLISGKPIGEPVAWSGPIVMNTQEELRTAFAEYREGTFIKHK